LPSLVNRSGQQITCKGIKSNFFFSCHAEKEEFPPAGDYPDYYEKVKHYFDLIAAPALCLEPEAWNLINKPLETEADESPLRYMDTNASRARITSLYDKFKGLKIGIIGLGGTGSYILDLVAKLPVAEIHLFDADEINNHNAFRAPGAMKMADLSKAPKKVDYYASLYDKMHRDIIAHAVMVTTANFAELDQLDYVFLSLDSVAAKCQIAGYLIDKGIPFIDSGMGIGQNPDGKLSGMIHVALGTPDCYQHLSDVMGSADAENDMYASDIQIAELNSLAANLSVIRWKKMLGFYADIRHEPCSFYTTNCNEIDNYESKEI
jgi:molybdopterin/thiamine biosynthesis adenylyltransferase